MTSKRTVQHNAKPQRAPSAPPAQAPGTDLVTRFGALVKERRRELKLTQDDLALASGVGRKFVIALEDGKPSIQLGKALIVAETLGLRLFDMMSHGSASGPLLPDLPDDTDLPP